MNYQLELDKIINGLKEADPYRPPKLLIHSCCAPCSSYVLEYLSQYFSITVFYYNPNIYPLDEYTKRVREQERLITSMPLKYPVTFMEGKYEPQKFFDLAKEHEKDPEGGERCFLCYRLRLEEAARIASKGGFDFFTTTLTVSPYKNAAKLNEIGEEVGALYGVSFLPSDFKKRGGYQRSIELSREYGLYRQNYCGCIYSKIEREQKEQEQYKNRGENTVSA